MKIQIRPEIDIPMCNHAAGKNGSNRLLGSQATERNVKWMQSATFVLREFTSVFMKKQLRSRQRQLGKTAAIKAGASLCLWTEIQPYGLEAGKIAFFLKNAYKLSIATCSCISLTCL